MDRLRLATGVVTGTILALTVLVTGCATKKYVRSSVEPLETRLGKVEEQNTEDSRRITEVDQKSEKGITEAKSAADVAAKDAAQAGQQAQQAHTVAQKGLTEAEQVREELKNVDNFQPLKTETVQFGFNRSDLTEEARRKLDDIASLVSATKRYVIEVEGFTDRTGPADYNLELSRRRADAVIRYLTGSRDVPLARVFQVGYGEDSPAAPNDTREGREQNRRVEVRVLATQQVASQTQ